MQLEGNNYWNGRNALLKPAMGDIKTIVHTEKTRLILSDEHSVITLLGATGNGKSMLGTLKMLARIFKAEKYQKQFVLAGRDIIALERRFKESANSVFNWKPFVGKWEYKKMDTGGSRFTIHTRTGKKYLYLTPFNNIASYSRVLGDTINGGMIDEATEADEIFLQEMLARVTRTLGSWLILTSNGGDPEHFFYTHIVNKSLTVDDIEGVETTKKGFVNGVRSMPDEELAYFEKERNKNFMCIHLALEDNPTYTAEQLTSFYNLYPTGSYMYYSRILGIRGFAEESPFGQYVSSKDIWVKKVGQTIVDNKGESYVIGSLIFVVDSGGHVFTKKDMIDSHYNEGDHGTTDGGHTVLGVFGLTRDYSRVFFLEADFPNEMIHDVSAEKINRKVLDWSMVFPFAKRPYMFADPADSSMLASLRDKVKNITEIRNAVKRDNSINLDEPVVITLIQQYMMRGRFGILDTEKNRKWIVPALMNAKQEKDGKLFDNGSWESDIRDIVKYLFSSMYRLLVIK